MITVGLHLVSPVSSLSSRRPFFLGGLRPVARLQESLEEASGTESGTDSLRLGMGQNGHFFHSKPTIFLGESHGITIHIYPFS